MPDPTDSLPPLLADALALLCCAVCLGLGLLLAWAAVGAQWL